MIAVDTSALMAILLDEPDKPHHQEILAKQTCYAIHEAAIVLRSRSGRPAVAKRFRCPPTTACCHGMMAAVASLMGDCQ